MGVFKIKEVLAETMTGTSVFESFASWLYIIDYTDPLRQPEFNMQDMCVIIFSKPVLFE